MSIRTILGVIIGITLVATFTTTTLLYASDNTVEPLGFRKGSLIDTSTGERKAPPTITGDNIYISWWTNKTANNNEEIMFRASTDGGATFGDKINLSNTTDADSTRVEIDSDADSVVVTWWETNQTSDTPVMRVSNDNGATFGPTLMLATNGTIGEAAEEEPEEG
jgi:hypothetical protein